MRIAKSVEVTALKMGKAGVVRSRTGTNDCGNAPQPLALHWRTRIRLILPWQKRTAEAQRSHSARPRPQPKIASQVPSPRGAMHQPRGSNVRGARGCKGSGVPRILGFLRNCEVFVSNRDPTPLHPLAPCGSVPRGCWSGSTGRGDRSPCRLCKEIFAWRAETES